MNMLAQLIGKADAVTAIQTIPVWRLAISLVPVFAVLMVLWHWNQNVRTSIHAVLRMLVQLLLVGYVLTAIFQAQQSYIVLGVLLLMTTAASWISLRTVPQQRRKLIWVAFASIGICGILTLMLVTQLVLGLQPWFAPSKLIPLGGMILSSGMNTVSLAAERFQSEIEDGKPMLQARATALQTALIPITNSLFAVGVVSFPGMMTGQVLSGVSPLIAVRYQIMVMCMTFGGSGLTAAMYLSLVSKHASVKTP